MARESKLKEFRYIFDNLRGETDMKEIEETKIEMYEIIY